MLDIPILYLSRYIIENKADYYRLIQAVRDEDHYEEWVVWILKGIEETAKTTTEIVRNNSNLMIQCKSEMQTKTTTYSKELLDCIFYTPLHQNFIC